MKNVFIEGRRTGYSVGSCGDTMTVGELINFLQDFDEDSKIYLSNDNGYTYGNITEYTIWEDEEDDECLEDDEEE